MNFLGHTFVALATGRQGRDPDPGPDPLYVLGAALPDLVSMAGVRIERGRAEGPLGDGLRCHTAADAVFHSQPAFLEGSSAIGAELREGGMHRGPARAIGHAGWELLLDGMLVGSDVEAAFHRAVAVGAEVEVETAIVERHRPRWLSFLARWGERPTPSLRYDDPAWVADRLYAMLADRRLLSFGSDELPAVREVLTAHRSSVAAVAGDLLAHVSVGTSEVLDCRP